MVSQQHESFIESGSTPNVEIKPTDARANVGSIEGLEQDICFLENKIKVLKSQVSPNKKMLGVFEQMLSNRVSVLEKLQSNHRYEKVSCV